MTTYTVSGNATRVNDPLLGEPLEGLRRMKRSDASIKLDVALARAAKVDARLDGSASTQTVLTTKNLIELARAAEREKARQEFERDMRTLEASIRKKPQGAR